MTMQRLSLAANVRRARDTDHVLDYLTAQITDAGGTIRSALGVHRKRGGRVSILADADNAVDVMNAVRLELDGDTNAYTADHLDDLRIGAFRSSGGGYLGFVNEDYRVVREHEATS